jgi:hypothetical protein
MTEETQLVGLLREIRDQQREALKLQRDHIELYQAQLARIERINDRAESMQGRAGKALRLILIVVLPAMGLLLMLMFWPYLRPLLA